jgi:hypothetical protein
MGGADRTRTTLSLVCSSKVGCVWIVVQIAHGKGGDSVNDLILIPDDLLNSLGEFYSSEYVAKNQPWILEMTFEQYVQREMRIRTLTRCA